MSYIRILQVVTVAASVAAVLAASPARADEVSELKAAVQALQKRLDSLEAQAKSVEETNDRQTDQIAIAKASVGSWVPNFTFKGDLRYRNENIEQQYSPKRNRDRIRARTGFVAKVNDTIRTEFGLATAEASGIADGGDPRSSNQTLTNGNSRKGVYLDLAYVEWQPHADWKVTAGKMKYPWVRAGQSVFFDGDVNPEGLAVNFSHGDFFASTFYNQLEERNAVGTGAGIQAAGESSMGGAQVGWRPLLGPGRLTLGASYFDANSVQRRVPAYSAANGNTTTNTGCFNGTTGCLANDYDLIELFGEYTFTVAGRPLALYVDYFRNDKAINSFDAAYSTGILYGRASDPRTWELGFYYARVEKDALYGEYIDSDWNGGNTDGKGGTFKAAYAPARNWTLNLTYFMNKSNVNVPVTVAGVGSVSDRDYKRLQIDMNFKY
jgi:Putative porin